LTKNTIYALVPCANPDFFAVFSSVFLWDAWLFPFGFFQQLNFKTGTSYVRSLGCMESGWWWMLDMTGERERDVPENVYKF